MISIRAIYFSLNEEDMKRYRINQLGWGNLHEALTYLILNENRISKLFEVLKWCEFALIASEGSGAKSIQPLIKIKLEMMNPLFEKLRDELLTAHSELRNLLEGPYVASHNFDENTADLNSIRYNLVPKKNEYMERLVIVPAPGALVVNGGSETYRKRVFSRKH